MEDDRRAGSDRRPGASSRGSDVGEDRHAAEKPRSSTSSRSISNSAVSRLVDEDQPLRADPAIWRQSSEPIEPPAPVTSTVSSREVRRDRSRSTSTGSRPRTSSTCTGRICARGRVAGDQLVAGPAASSPARRPRAATSTIRWRASPGRGRDRDQHLVRAVVAQEARQLVRRPEHADAVDAQVLLARVVVDEADRRGAERRLRCISRMTSWPASPAPTISTSLPRATRPAGPAARSSYARAGASRATSPAAAASP